MLRVLSAPHDQPAWHEVAQLPGHVVPAVNLAQQTHDDHVVHRATQGVRPGQVDRRHAARRVRNLLRDVAPL